MAASKQMQAVISIAGALDPSLARTIQQATKQASGLGAAFKAAGAIAAAGISAIGNAAMEGGKAILDLGMRFDEASDAIRIGTGATGEALQALNADFDAVYKAVPTTMDDAAQAIADYNTRLGLTGPALQELSSQALQVSNMLGDDLGSVIEESSKAFQQWGLDAEDMGAAMDYVFKASQSTGTGFTELLTSVKQFGPQLQEMGFSFEEATALIGQLDKAGVNTSEVLGALKKSVTSMAKEGLSASEGLTQYIDAIKNAGDAAEATSIAAEVFGARAGSTMAAAIRNGTLSVDELTAALEASDESILKAAADTEDFPEKLQRIKQNAEVAFRPLGEAALDIANRVMPYLQSAIEQLAPMITSAVEAAIPVIEGIADAIMPMAESMIQAIVPAVQGMIGYIVEGLPVIVGIVSETVGAILPLVMGFAEAVMPLLMQLGEAIMPLIATIADILFPTLMQIVEMVLPFLQELVSAVLPIVITLINTLTPILQAIAPVLEPILGALGLIFDTAISLIQGVMSALQPLIDIIGGLLVSVIQGIAPVVTEVVDGVFGAFEGIITFITDVFTGNWEGAWQAVQDIFGNIFGALGGLVKVPINAVIGIINGAIDLINGLSIDIPDWVPFIGGQHFGLDIPHMDFLAKGGFTDGASIAGEAGTEAVISFDPAVRKENLSYWARAGKLLGANASAVDTVAASAMSGARNAGGNYITFSPNVTIQGNADYDTVLQALRDEEEEFMDMVQEFLARRQETAYV